MSTPCPTCFPIVCTSLEDQSLYSLESNLFPFLLECPPGFFCGDGDSFNMVCCGQLLSVQFPPGATFDDKQILIDQIVNECGVRMAACGNNFPNTPTILFYNSPKACTVTCPDGSSVFTYTVIAGVFAGTTQLDADTQAQNYACQQAKLLEMCLSPFPACLCVGGAVNTQVGVTGGIPPITFSVASGIPPLGLTLSPTGLLSGVPTTAGQYTFVIEATASDGSYTRRTYTASVLQITTTSLPAYSVGVPYSYQLQAAGGSGNYLWKIAAGSLPAGLTLSNTGLISGTPV